MRFLLSVDTKNKNDLETLFYQYKLDVVLETSEEQSSETEIWVVNEDDHEKVKKLLQDYESGKIDRVKLSEVAQVKIQKAKDKMDQKAQHFDVRTQVFFKSKPFGSGLVTFVLMGISILMYLISEIAQTSQSQFLYSIQNYFFFSRYVQSGLYEIFQGEVWRLVTPIFLHFGIFHILFNMIWLWDLGNLLEDRYGPKFYLLFIVVCAVSSNLMQFLASGPAFGGMSGVIYGFLGFAYTQARFDFRSRIMFPQNTFYFMAGWFLLCLFLGGLIETFRFANTAHAMGLFVGLVWGYFRSGHFLVLWRQKRINLEVVLWMIVPILMVIASMVVDGVRGGRA